MSAAAFGALVTVAAPVRIAAAAPRPQALAVAERTCSGTSGLVPYPTKNLFVATTSCTLTTSVAGTLYVTSSATVALPTNTAGKSAIAEYDLIIDGQSQDQSQRQVGVHSDGTDSSSRAMSTQASIAVSAGQHIVRLDGRETSGTAADPPATLESSISAFFVPSGGDEVGCFSPAAVTVPLSDDFDKNIVSCSLTVTKAGKAVVSASTGFLLDDNNRPQAGLRISVDGTPTADQAFFHVATTTTSDPSLNFTGAVQSVVTLTPGTHTVTMFVPSLTANAATSLRQPSIMAIFAPNDSTTVQPCEQATAGPVGVTSSSLVSIAPFCSVTTAKSGVLQLTAMVTIGSSTKAANADAYEPHFALFVDGKQVPASDRHVNVYTEPFLGSHLTGVIQADVAVPAGSHSAFLAVREDSGNTPMNFTAVSAVVRVVTEPGSTNPPSTNPPSTSPAADGDYSPVVPDRILDTRPDTQIGYSGTKPGAGQIIELQVTGVGTSQVPDGTAAVALNVTGTEAEAPGFVTVYPCGATRPTASNLNLSPGVSSPNLVVAKIGDGGKVCIYTQVATHLLADVNGYMPAGSRYLPSIPERLLDTRPDTQIGYSGAKPVAGATVTVQVTGAGSTNVPTDASAVVLNVTGTEAAAAGFVTVWPCGSPRPTASNLNIPAGGTSPNLVVAKIGTGGQVCIFVQSSMHLIADVAGYMPAGIAYVPVVPERLLETRTDGQVGYTGAKPTAGSTIELTVIGAGVTNVPAGTDAVVLNVTGVEPDADGFVTVWPCGSPRPTASNLNLTAGGISPNLVTAKVGDGGKVCIFTQASAHLLADILGYWL